jgi:hypothetical protein
MAKRKIFIKTVLDRDSSENGNQQGETLLPRPSRDPYVVELGFIPGRSTNSFSFASLYGIGVDEVTGACQRQIERFLNNQDKQVERVTVADYCFGLNGFLQYLSLRSIALGRELTLADINRNAIDGYLAYLADGEISALSQKNYYAKTKAVLKVLSRRKLIDEVVGGNDATFPRNRFPGVHRQARGESPLPKAHRQAFSVAVKSDVMPIFSDDAEPSAYVLVCALLVIALHTGRNTSPLLEMSRDCLRSHPKDNTSFLVVYKRRGHSHSKVALNGARDEDVDSVSAVRPSVVQLILRIIALSDRLRAAAPENLRSNIWLYRRQKMKNGVDSSGMVTALSHATLNYGVKERCLST